MLSKKTDSTVSFLKVVRSKFHYILLLQLPVLLTIILNELVPQDLMETNFTKVILFIVITIPLIVIVSSSTTGAIYIYIRDSFHKSFNEIYIEIFKKVKKLFFASLLATILTLIGLPTIVLSIYFSTIYIFVPQVVIDHYSFGVTEQLHTSKTIVKKSFFKPLIIAILNLVVEILHSLMLPELASLIESIVENNVLSFLIYISTISIFLLCYYAIINIYLALIYIKNKRGD